MPEVNNEEQDQIIEPKICTDYSTNDFMKVLFEIRLIRSSAIKINIRKIKPTTKTHLSDPHKLLIGSSVSYSIKQIHKFLFQSI
jgi:hypothetical protein